GEELAGGRLRGRPREDQGVRRGGPGAPRDPHRPQGRAQGRVPRSRGAADVRRGLHAPLAVARDRGSRGRHRPVEDAPRRAGLPLVGTGLRRRRDHHRDRARRRPGGPQEGDLHLRVARPQRPRRRDRARDLDHDGPGRL
ncbi:MAG: hypothetical protein AVDCRST_MAG45-1141, partial [uncultured Solirubrobacterales bacterium]